MSNPEIEMHTESDEYKPTNGKSSSKPKMKRRFQVFIVLFVIICLGIQFFNVSLEDTQTKVTPPPRGETLTSEESKYLNSILLNRTGSVYYLGKDLVTKGNWNGTYGSYAYVLPDAPRKAVPVPVGNYSMPTGSLTLRDYGWVDYQVQGLTYNRPDPPYWDVFKSEQPAIAYRLVGTLYRNDMGSIQYPVFEWAWGDTSARKDARVLDWPDGSGKKATCWEDGSDRGFPRNGYFNIEMEFPSGTYLLSLYAYDYERKGRSVQEIVVKDNSNSSLTTSTTTIGDKEFDEGIYLKFAIFGPSNVLIQVRRSSDSVNAILSGIFVDRILS